jgi:hypothetical protein
LLKSSWCKSSPARAVAGRPEASVAIRRVTGGCRSVHSEEAGREDSVPKSLLVAMPTPLALRKAVSRRTDNARSAGVAGIPSPGHVFTETSREPRRASCLFANMGCGSPVDKRTRSAVAAEGRRQKRSTSAAEVTCHQGKPEAAAIGRQAVLRTHSTREGGEPQGSRKGRPRYPLEGRGKQVDESMRGHRSETPNSGNPVSWT